MVKVELHRVNGKACLDTAKYKLFFVQEPEKGGSYEVIPADKDHLIRKNVYPLFEKFESTGYDGDTLLYNLETQVAGLALWEQQLDELSKKGLSEGLLEELREMGPDAAASIYSLNQMTEEQLKRYDDLWNQKMELAGSQAVKENEELRTETLSQIEKLKADARNELADLTQGAVWLDGQRFSGSASRETVSQWVNSLDLDWNQNA